MKSYLLILLAALGSISAGAATAEEMRTDTRAVIELFTSQGCSSCPPADALLAEMAKRDDVVALAYHVDYWDYIGWPDTFGDAAYSDLQRAYADSWNAPRIYTPQLIVNGTSDVVGSRRAEIGDVLDAASLPMTIDIRCEDDVMYASIAPQPGMGSAVVWLVTFKSSAEVAIERGENRGRTISYAQIVTDRQAMGIWDPEEGLDMKLPLNDIMREDSDGVALVVQQENDGLPGPVIAAASVVF